MGSRIRVTTENLIRKKEEWKTLLIKAEGIFEEIEGNVKGLEPIFSGKPVTMQKNRFMAQSQRGRSALAGLKEQVEKLEAIALIYEQTERRNYDSVTED